MLMRRFLTSLACGNQVLDLASPVVMSILNITPDSFYEASRLGKNQDQILHLAGNMLEDGAKILDVGGMSTRPGAIEIPVEEELNRVIPVIEALKRSFPEAILSVDTYRSEVALAAIHAGASMINDISGGSLDPGMVDLLGNHKVAYVMMHMKGKPSDMQSHTGYENLMGDIISYFVNKLRMLKQKGIHDIVIDPGFGFSKTIEQNFELIGQLDLLQFLEKPVMIGLSRKSSLSKSIGRSAEDTLEATTALHMAALERGASILRVHDVRPAIDAIAIFNKLQGSKKH
jgi:dihydropteroate synthase